jgi:hypothetical protein
MKRIDLYAGNRGEGYPGISAIEKKGLRSVKMRCQTKPTTGPV